MVGSYCETFSSCIRLVKCLGASTSSNSFPTNGSRFPLLEVEIKLIPSPSLTFTPSPSPSPSFSPSLSPPPKLTSSPTSNSSPMLTSHCSSTVSSSIASFIMPCGQFLLVTISTSSLSELHPKSFVPI
ncbi:hypothetical protein CIPAW_13G045400 [Carya illinoinensis]|uniref:Uncharacterized protein n=1 Tax=Carya illinoinensis TaxID=32201 RepID=A0A8T1NNN8_CARIL|nr:hypothetical protein CIPAW_13G045400 [Carya illinoinensis]